MSHARIKRGVAAGRPAMECQVPQAVIDIAQGGCAPHRGVKPRTARLLHCVPPLRVTPRPPRVELINGSLARTTHFTRVAPLSQHRRSPHLVRAVVSENDIDAAQQLARDGAHGCTPRLALRQPTLDTRPNPGWTGWP